MLWKDVQIYAAFSTLAVKRPDTFYSKPIYSLISLYECITTPHTRHAEESIEEAGKHSHPSDAGYSHE